MRRTLLLALSLAGLAACQHALASAPDNRAVAPVTAERVAQLNAEIREVMAENEVLTAGVAVIRNGEVAWIGHYGEQAPGIPADRRTLFNVASLAKSVTTETVLRLASAGAFSLDESMSPHWVDPHLADDPRHTQLTPRMALSHRTGFPNWRIMAEDRRLGFMTDPGAAFGYSGEGFEYLARFTQERTGEPFEALAQKHVFTPSGMTDVAMSPRRALYERIAVFADEEGPRQPFCRPEGWCTPEGDFSAADDLVVTVEDYAAFLIGVMEAQGLTSGIADERFRVHSPVDGDAALVHCQAFPELECPRQQGYGLGWEVAVYGPDDLLVSHGGSDWAELALAYYYSRSRDGVIVFLNGPSSGNLPAMAEIVALIDPNSPLIGRYHRWTELAQD